MPASDIVMYLEVFAGRKPSPVWRPKRIGIVKCCWDHAFSVANWELVKKIRSSGKRRHTSIKLTFAREFINLDL